MGRVNEDFVKRLCERLRLYFGEVSVRIDLNTAFGCTSIEVSLSNKETMRYTFRGDIIDDIDDIVQYFVRTFPGYLLPHVELYNFELESEPETETGPITPVEGIKYDKGKPRMCEMIQDFAEPLEEVAKVWAFGADKYSKGNWRYVLEGEERYSNALMRHLLAEQNRAIDLESGLYHAAHVAWNALARLYFIKKRYASEVCKSED